MESRAREGLRKGATLNTPRLWMILCLALGVLGALAFGFSGGKTAPPVPPVPPAAPRPPSRPLQTGPAPKRSESKPLQGLAVSYPNEPLPVDLERRLFLLLRVYESALIPPKDPKVLRCSWEKPKPRFARQEDRGLRAGRILCLADPERARRLLKGWALDSSQLSSLRTFAVALLGEMAAAGHPEGPNDLLEVAQSQNALAVRDEALMHLYPLDLQGIGKTLYRERFAQGECSWAAWAIVLWADPEHVAAVQKREGNPGSENFLAAYLEILQAPDRNQRLIRHITELTEAQSRWMPWALEAALIHQTPGVKEALRARLDAEAAIAAQINAGRIKKGLNAGTEPLDTQYVSSSGGDAIFEYCHDETLLAYWRLGGELTEREKQRLNYHGFIGDQTENMKGIR